MGKSLKFDRVVDFDYLSAYEVIEKLVERFGVEDVQNALNEIAAQHRVQSDLGWKCAVCESTNLASDLECGYCDTPRPSR